MPSSSRSGRPIDSAAFFTVPRARALRTRIPQRSHAARRGRGASATRAAAWTDRRVIDAAALIDVLAAVCAGRAPDLAHARFKRASQTRRRVFQAEDPRARSIATDFKRLTSGAGSGASMGRLRGIPNARPRTPSARSGMSTAHSKLVEVHPGAMRSLADLYLPAGNAG
jgi:hypothetical protein